jgi:hypothetical protein
VRNKVGNKQTIRAAPPWGDSNDFRYRAIFAFARLSGEKESLERLHNTIEREIARSSRALERALKSQNQDFIEGLVDEECLHVEQLLGLAFVAAQYFINAVRTRWITTIPLLQSELPGFDFPVGRGGLELFKHSTTLRIGKRYSSIEIINAVANYWKHSEEWPTTHVKKTIRGTARLVPVWNLASLKAFRREPLKLPCNSDYLLVPAAIFGVRRRN